MPALDGLQCDVAVIGGGPAGLAAAIALRLRGFRVALADAREPPIDKPCGEGILPPGVEALRKLGIMLGTGDGFSLRGIRFMERGRSVEASFPAARGVGLRRTRLHEMLVCRAAEVGVQFCWGTSVPDLSGLSNLQWIVGADGEGSRIRRACGLDSARLISHRFGFRRHYQLAPWTDFVEIHWGAGYQVYVTPVGPDEIGVALLTRNPHLRLDAALDELPSLSGRLQGAQVTSTEGGASTTTRRLRRVYRGHAVLVGDASGSVDAITGEGLSLGFLQSLSLAQALEAGDPAIYQASHRRQAKSPVNMARALLLLDRLPPLRRAVWRVFGMKPSLMDRVLTRYAEAETGPKAILEESGY